MLKIIKNTLQNLIHSEKKTLLTLIVCNFWISVLDIASFAVLVFIIGFYANHYTTVQVGFLQYFSQNKLLLIVIFLLLFALKNLVAYFIFQMQYNFVYKVASRISRNNLYSFLKGNYSDYSQVNSSVNIRKISYQPIEFCHYVLAGLQQIFTEIMLAGLAVLAILIYNPQLFLLLFLALLPPVFFITYITKRKLKTARENVKTASETSLQHLHEALSGYVESNIYNKNSFFTDRYTTSQTRLNAILSQIQSIQAAPVRLIETFAVFGLFLLIAANQFRNNSSVLDIINIGAFLAAAYKIIPSIVKIINLSGQVKTYQYTTHNSPASPYIAIEKNALIPKHHLRSVELKNIFFSHKSHSIINSFNFKIEEGEFIGISGASGKGKTTIINLLLGFILPEKGEVLVNNKAISEENKIQFWQNIALVKQQPFVIADSILNNIILCDESYNKQRLEEAVNIAGLEDLINKYPEGIHKTIAENSKNISGGQQQRIALARAIYKNADLIILDESFSELDDASEHKILKYFQELAETGKMIIYISHNNNSLAYCHKIISLDA